MSHIHYLTVQDILWINQKVTGKVNKFAYSTLEEATFCQYAYGSATGAVPQAGRFLGGFLRKLPFDDGNEATALVACAVFLKLNGYDLKVDGMKWLQPIAADPSKAADEVRNAADAGHEGKHDEGLVIPDPKGVITDILGRMQLVVTTVGA